MPMSVEEYLPALEIPYHSPGFADKKRYTLEEALLSALHTTTRCKESGDSFDVVALRLRSYMLNRDPILQGAGNAIETSLQECGKNWRTVGWFAIALGLRP